MTDKTVSNSPLDPMDDAHSNGNEAVTPDSSQTPETTAESDWELVNFPGHLSVDQSSSSETPIRVSEPAIESTILPPSNSKESATNTDELIQLIQDLNHCNDALLNRVSDLEEALERSHAALQAEIERNQGVRVNECDSTSGAVPQQIAQLLSELEVSNDGLRRTTMHNEALQAELNISQQRVAQLERECTLLQQRFNEKSTALQQAEHTCRDLKSRLHRQQRYTLQFKAALEKCLNMSANTCPGVDGPAPVTVESQEAPVRPVSMPRSQQIQPWSSSESTSNSDVSLTDLLRSLKSPGQGPQALSSEVASPPAPPLPLPPEKVTDPEAESLLWQDLARVTESQATVSPSFPVEIEPDPWDASGANHTQTASMPEPVPLSEDNQTQLAFTEPSPWGEPLPNHTASDTVSETPDSPEPVVAEPVSTEPPSSPVFVGDPGDIDPGPQALPDIPSSALSHSTRVNHYPATRPDYRPGTSNPSTTPPSPLVYPLRSQKRRKTLAAVELPSFGRTPRRR